MNLVEFRPRALPAVAAIVQLAERFLRSIAARGLAEATVNAYRLDLEQFAGFLAGRDQHYIQALGLQDLEDFAAALAATCTPRTVARKQAVVKQLFEYAEACGVISSTANPARRWHRIRFHANRVIAPDADVLLRVIDGISGDSPWDKRDRALLRVMYDSALRVSGLISLDIYNPESPPLCTITPAGVVMYRAKGGAIRDSVIGQSTLDALNAYLEVRWRCGAPHLKEPEETALFVGRGGERLTRQGVNAIVRRRGAAAGLRLHPHLFRHRRIGDVIERCGVRLGQYIAGHARPSTTLETYGWCENTRLRETIRRDASLEDCART